MTNEALQFPKSGGRLDFGISLMTLMNSLDEKASILNGIRIEEPDTIESTGMVKWTLEKIYPKSNFEDDYVHIIISAKSSVYSETAENQNSAKPKLVYFLIDHASKNNLQILGTGDTIEKAMSSNGDKPTYTNDHSMVFCHLRVKYDLLSWMTFEGVKVIFFKEVGT